MIPTTRRHVSRTCVDRPRNHPAQVRANTGPQPLHWLADGCTHMTETRPLVLLPLTDDSPSFTIFQHLVPHGQEDVPVDFSLFLVCRFHCVREGVKECQ